MMQHDNFEKLAHDLEARTVKVELTDDGDVIFLTHAYD